MNDDDDEDVNIKDQDIVASFKFSPRRTFEEDKEDGPNLRRT